jgi:purine-binding chemotaxis protein CheW
MTAELSTTVNSFLSFKLGEELFAANVGKVLEILELTKITKVPQSPNYMRGVINLRGNVLPVVDTRIKFGMPETKDTINTCIIVLDIDIDQESVKVGLLVDMVQEVLQIDAEHIQPPPSIGNKFKAEFIKGMGKVDDEFVMILDIDHVLTTDEISIIQSSVNEPDNENKKKTPTRRKKTAATNKRVNK